MSEYSDIAGSDDIISLNLESQETLNEHSYRAKPLANRTDKSMPMKDQAKENQKPIEQVNNEETDPMQTDTQNCSIPTVNNEVSTEQPPSSIDTQNNLVSDNPFIIQPPMAHSTLTDENVVSGEKDVSPEKSSIDDQKTPVVNSASKPDSSVSGLDASATTNNLRLYISPSTSLLETTNDDAQPNPSNVSTTEIEEKNKLTELDNKPKDEPMDTSDAQASLGSDGIIDSQPTSALIIESTSVTEKSTKVESPNQSKTIISPASKALYALSQPATNKFESILAKLTASPARHTTSAYGNENESNITTREEEELFIKESISKVVRRYAVKIDQNGRTISRELLNERTVEENTTTRIESWPPQEKKNRRSITKTHRPTETTRKKPTKSNVPKRKTKSLKPTSNAISPKPSKPAQSDDDEVSKTNTNEDSTDDDNNDDDDDDDVDDAPTDDISGDEFIPTSKSSTGRSLKKGLRVFAKWVDGHFYPGVIGNSNGEKYMIDFDDGAKRHVKANDIICQSYLEADQNVLAQTQDGYFDSGIIKRLIKKKKTGKLGYIVEKDGKEKWYPLRFVSLTHEQAEHLPIVNHNTEASTNIVQGKRKRTLTVPQSPNKKTKSSIFPSPNKSQRTTHTPTRLTKLFNTMHFLLTGFNDSMDIRHKVEDAIETHGGKVIEKMPTANRRENVYLISDTARKTAKFLDAKKLNIPCVNYKWIHESIEKGEIQDWNIHKLVVPEKETKTNNDDIDDHQED